MAATAVALVAVVLAGFPLVTGSLTAPGGFDEIPPAWHQAARWVDAHDGTTRTLLLPGAAFAENTWGRPLDEPWGVLADGSWAVRDLIPLGGNGSTRLLDGLDAALAGDELPDGFVAALQRAGVGHLVVRNDLDLPRTGGPAPATVRRLLATEPRLRRVASFGPRVRSADAGGDLRLAATAGDLAPADLRQIEVYAVPDPAGRAAAYPVAGRLVVGGAAEAMVSLPGTSSPGGRRSSTTTAARAPRSPATRTASWWPPTRLDVETSTSGRCGRTPPTRWRPASPRRSPTARCRTAGPTTRRPSSPSPASRARSITSDGGQGDVGPGHQPFAAFDGDRTTTWTPAAPAVGRWVQVTLDRPRRVPSVRMAIPATEGERIRSVRVVTDGGSRTVAIGPDGTAAVATPPGDTTFVRIEVAEVTAGQVVATLGLSEVELEGVRWPGPWWRCRTDRPTSPSWCGRRRTRRRSTDWRRTPRSIAWWSWPRGGTGVLGYGVGGARAGARRRPRCGDAEPATRCGASHRHRGLGRPTGAGPVGRDRRGPRHRLGDRSLAHGTRARPGVGRPGHRRTDPHPPLATGTDRVRSVRIAIGDRRYQRRLPASGVVSIPATEAEALSITFDPGRAVVHRVGIAEVEVDGLAGRHATVPDRDAEVGLPCGSGPVLVVDGNPQPTRAQATAGELLDGSPVGWSSCDPLALEARAHRITGSDGDDGADGALRIDRLTAAAGPGARALAAGGPPTDARRVRVADWGATERTVAVGPGTTAVLATTENRNDGWTATLDGRSLRAIQVDGWRQGFVVPAGDGGRIELRFTPAPVHRAGIAVGVLGGLALAARRSWAGADGVRSPPAGRPGRAGLGRPGADRPGRGRRPRPRRPRRARLRTAARAAGPDAPPARGDRRRPRGGGGRGARGRAGGGRRRGIVLGHRAGAVDGGLAGTGGVGGVGGVAGQVGGVGWGWFHSVHP
ncbi:MAG: alpha-(1-_3)-arabinofuranosyltransferase family protein [Acidimicrobiales bacterium]